MWSSPGKWIGVSGGIQELIGQCVTVWCGNGTARAELIMLRVFKDLILSLAAATLALNWPSSDLPGMMKVELKVHEVGGIFIQPYWQTRTILTILSWSDFKNAQNIPHPLIAWFTLFWTFCGCLCFIGRFYMKLNAPKLQITRPLCKGLW